MIFLLSFDPKDQPTLPGYIHKDQAVVESPPLEAFKKLVDVAFVGHGVVVALAVLGNVEFNDFRCLFHP